MKQVRPKKNLGQHFLTDLSVAKQIADTVDACPEIPILEIGPGMGVLTRYLVEKPREVKAVEIDKESVCYLNEAFPKLRDNILGEDFLRMDLDKVFEGRPFVLTGTVAIMIIALVIRRIPYTIRSSVATLQQISLSVEEASLSLGASKMRTFFGITVPMMANGILSGAILSWITIMTELSTGIILYTNKTMTMTLAVYNFVTRGSYGYAAAFSSILTLITILSLCLFLKLSKNGEISF